MELMNLISSVNYEKVDASNNRESTIVSVPSCFAGIKGHKESLQRDYDQGT